VHLYETISRIKKTTKVLSQEFGRKPTEEEIAESMEMTIEKLRFIAKSAQLPISLETPIGKEEDSRLGDFIEADIENPEQDVAKNLLREDLEGVLATLSPRERDVLRLRYGLDDGRMKTSRGDRPDLRCDAGAHPSDRGEGAAQAASPQPQRRAQGIHLMYTGLVIGSVWRGEISPPPDFLWISTKARFRRSTGVSSRRTFLIGPDRVGMQKPGLRIEHRRYRGFGTAPDSSCV
jgi:DNA-directed RNA polymerase, sigma subunit (sigma70/sigma32)